MVDQIVVQLQPVIVTIVVALIGCLATYALVAIKRLQGRAAAWLESRTTASDRETLHKIGLEAWAFAETTFLNSGGPMKLDAALAYATDKLKAQGINLSVEEIKATIHEAWLKAEQIDKIAKQEITVHVPKQ